jgi:hypothetical protein
LSEIAAIEVAFLTGRLARWAALERWLDGVLDRGDVWIAPMEAIARHAMAHRDLLRADQVTGEPA